MSSRSQAASVPLLKEGDRMEREEFERRWDAMPELKKAELIEGVVYMPSPTSFFGHGEEHANIMGWLWSYRLRTPGTDLADAPSVRMGKKSMPQPDAVMIIDPARGGKTTTDGKYISGGPELVVEVALSSAQHDRDVKLPVYQKHGVGEYLLWRVAEGEIDWFVNTGAKFEPLSAAEDGIARSRGFPGLWLDVAAMTKGEIDKVWDVLQQGLASDEHAEFVARLKAHSSENS